MTPTDYHIHLDRVTSAAEREIDCCEKKLSGVRKVMRKMQLRAGYYRRLSTSDEVKPFKRERAKDRAAIYASVVRAIDAAIGDGRT